MESIGTRIRRARQRRGLSQEELADLVGVSRRSVGNWERDATHPSGSLARIEDLLGPVTGPEPAPEITAVAEAEPPVLRAIREDTTLLPEARSHLESQYRLLLRIGQDREAPADDLADVRSLPRVARKRTDPPNRRG